MTTNITNRGPIYLSYCDPASRHLQGATGLTQRQIVSTCKRNGWPWRKVYGRIWVCADFAQRLKESQETP